MTSLAEVFPFSSENPEDIVFVDRTTSRQRSKETAYITRHSDAGNSLLCIKKSLVTEMFPNETKFDFSRGQHPNEAWLKITPNKRGVKLVGALYFSIGSIVPRERVQAGERHEVELHPRTDALYVKLPWNLIK